MALFVIVLFLFAVSGLAYILSVLLLKHLSTMENALNSS